MNDETIIVGIDPGTTTAIAILNLDGEVKHLYSRKDLSLAECIRIISTIGLPAIITSDKKKTPDFVRQLSAKLGGKLFRLTSDMPVSDKRLYTKPFKTTNDHERDALGACIFAFKRSHGLINRIKTFCTKNKRLKLFQKISYYVLSKGVSITFALSLLEESDKKEVKLIKKAIDENIINSGSGLLKKINVVFEENKILKLDLKNVRRENLSLRKDLKFKDSKMDSIKAGEFKDRVVSQKGYELKDLKKKNLRLSKQNRGLNKRIIALEGLIPKLKDYNVIPSYKKLSKEFINVSKIKKNSFIHISDGFSFSPSIKNALKNKKIILLCTDYSKEIKNDFLVLNISKLDVKKVSNYILVLKIEMDKLLKKANLLENILNEYKKERKE